MALLSIKNLTIGYQTKKGLIIADEPTTALDVIVQGQIFSEIKQVQEQTPDRPWLGLFLFPIKKRFLQGNSARFWSLTVSI